MRQVFLFFPILFLSSLLVACALGPGEIGSRYQASRQAGRGEASKPVPGEQASGPRRNAPPVRAIRDREGGGMPSPGAPAEAAMGPPDAAAGDADMLNRSGEILLEAGLPVEAELYFRRALALRQDAAFRKNLALALCRQDRHNEAFSELFLAGGAMEDYLEMRRLSLGTAQGGAARAIDQRPARPIVEAAGLRGPQEFSEEQDSPDSGQDAPLETERLAAGEKPDAAGRERGDDHQAERSASAAARPVPASAGSGARAAVPVGALGLGAEASCHVLLESSWQTPAKAGRRVDKLSRKGLTAFIARADLGGKGVWYRVVIGPVSTEAEMDTLRRKLTAGFGSTSPLTLRCDDGLLTSPSTAGRPPREAGIETP